MKKSANTKPTEKPKRKAPPTAWKKGQSGNPAGAPKRGESWAEIFKAVGDMTPAAAADYCKSIAGQLKSLGDAITLKQAVALRVYAALLFEPQAGLLNSIMDRAEGKVKDTLEVRTWRDRVIDLLKSERVTPAEVVAEFGPSLASELFAAAGVVVSDDATS